MPGNFRIIFLVSITFACSLLLFIGGPSNYSSRSIHCLWDWGHIFFFAILTYLILYFFPRIKRFPITNFFAAMLAGAFSLGALIELSQHFVSGRTSSLGDLNKDIVGCALVLIFSPLSKKIDHSESRILVRSIVIVFLLWQLWPFTRALADEIVAFSQFPVLSNFETPFELDRWFVKGNNSAMMTDAVALRSKRSLKVILRPMKYSGLSLKYFPGDWHGYSQLGFDINNDYVNKLTLTCRIHDKNHIANGQEYNDRFNQRLTLNPGWQHITIKFDELIAAPKGRKVDITDILGVGLFATNLQRNRIIYIDNIALYQ